MAANWRGSGGLNALKAIPQPTTAKFSLQLAVDLCIGKYTENKLY